MCNVYSFSGFAKILLKHQIQFSIRDFLDDRKVDLLIQQVVNKTCNPRSWCGAGIARSCFIEPNKLAAIKVSKNIYTDITDYDAEDEWADLNWNVPNDEYDPYGYVIDELKNAIYMQDDEGQNLTEIRNYKEMILNKSPYLQYVPITYAASSSGSVQIVEFCDYADWEMREQSDRRRFIEKSFCDTHEANFGLNKHGLLVLLDYGFGGLF